MGQQFLFNQIKTPQFTEEPLLRFERFVNCFSNANLRERLQVELNRLSHRDALFLPYLFLEDLPQVRYRFLNLAISLATVASLIGALFSKTSRAVAVFFVTSNMVISLYSRSRLEGFLQPLRLLNVLINTAQRIADQFEGTEISEQTEKLKDEVKILTGLRRKTALLSLDNEADDATNMLYQYLNMALLLDVNCYAFAVEELRHKRAHVADCSGSRYRDFKVVPEVGLRASDNHNLLKYLRAIR